MPLKTLMPRLYNISRWQGCSIKVVKERRIDLSNNRWSRNLKAWEEDLENQIFIILNRIVLSKRKDLVM